MTRSLEFSDLKERDGV